MSDILQLINTAYCCSAVLSIIVLLVARGCFLCFFSIFFLKKAKGAESRLFCFLLKGKALRIGQSFMAALEAGTFGIGSHGVQRAALARPGRRSSATHSPRAVAPKPDDAQNYLGSFWNDRDYEAPACTHNSFPLPPTPPQKGLTTGYQENRPPLPLPGARRSGNSLLITAVVISDFNWQQRELNWSPRREASSMRQTSSLLSCGVAV